MSRISKDIPISEITLRKYEKPEDFKDRELVRKLCLSIGVLQPGDSRDVIVDVLYVLLKAKRKKLSLEEIKESVITLRKKKKLPMLGIAPSNLRRQVRRLKDLFLVESSSNKYRITEGLKMGELFEEKIKAFYLDSIIKRVKDYCNAIDEQFKKR